ncbi:autotransporter outer membrane beta-barrel domain-containing protein [Parvibaculum sp.]|uniref:autotransporter outer membrane beta-barrel domain-containing protein n=1 Tax=Parvibaculum sp. TaxID=2024848 RepID=UPI002C996F99|nr:autotransporter domain-containing protein [Parvibaculum sp.]HUD53132.1 autotransporter domain-containing protein [Parvibaculum sp.]
MQFIVRETVLASRRRLFKAALLQGTMLAAAAILPSPASAGSCTATGTLTTEHCGSDYVQVIAGSGTSSVTLDGYTTTSVELTVDPLATGPFDQTVTLTGPTVLNKPDYSGVIMQTYAADRNATVIANEDVSITSVGGFGGIWVRNDTSGNIIIDSAATVDASGAGADGLTGSTNHGAVTITNKGHVTAHDARGLYADGGYSNASDDPVTVSIDNQGTVDAYLAGARAVDYHGLAKITNSGTVTSTTRQGLVAWSDDGNVEIDNSGTATAYDDHALQAWAADDVTVTNSGTLNAYDDTSHTDVGTGGHYGIDALSLIAGDVKVTNTATGIINSPDDYGIHAGSPEGSVTVENDGKIDGKSGVWAENANGNAKLINSGTISADATAVLLDGTTNTLDNTGSITTTGTVAVQTGDGDATVTNSGTIAAASSSDTAILFGAGDDHLTIKDNSTITGLVLAGAGDDTLEFAGSGSFDLGLIGASAQYRDFEIIEKTGTGTWTMSNDSGFTGDVNIDGGKLSVNGTLLGDVTVGDGGTLGGNGTIAGLTVESGGTAAPGNSIGTINVSGPVSFMTGSSYDVEIDAAGNADRIIATGVAHLAGTVNVSAASGIYAPLTTYTILTAGSIDPVDSHFDGLSYPSSFDSFAFLTPALSYDAQNVYLTLDRNSVAFADVAITPNEKAAAGALDTAAPSNEAYLAVLSLGAAEAPHAFDRLSGEIHASARAAMTVDARLPRDAVLSRLDRREDGTGGLWMKALGDWGTIDGDGNADKLSHDTAGLLIGFDDMASANWTIGAALGYTDTDLELASRADHGKTKTAHVLAYAGAHYGALRVKLGVGYSAADLDIHRSVTIGTFSDHPDASYDGDVLQGFAELGYEMPMGKATLEPFAALAVVRAHTESFAESGGDARLSGAGETETRPVSTLGLRAATPLAGPLDLSAMAGWQHTGGTLAPESRMNFTSGSSFTVAGVPLARDAAVAELDLGYKLSDVVSISATYSGLLADDAQSHTLSANVSLTF